jgi:acyl phosphate:glycerol-3-phosphate acyltransferase
LPEIHGNLPEITISHPEVKKMREALAVIIGYFLGAIPTAYIAGRLTRGIDIRQIGGRNMGALNTAREIGPLAGLFVLLGDAAKGAAAILIAQAINVNQIWIFLTGISAIAGHNWPVFLKFRGGKGAATSIGIFLALSPAAFACTLPVLVLVVLLTSNVTLGIAFSLLLFPLSLWLWGQPLSMIVYAIAVAILLGLRYLATAKRSLKQSGSLKSFLIEKAYKPWQTRK